MIANLPPIIGVSAAVKHAIALIERFAPTGLAILLIGATGTGKELFARHIHHRSRRRGALVDVNCGALPQEITESLLFGHRRGAFTGAVESVVGHFERANGGTLFLDEVVHLSVPGQVKLLRALETGEVQPVGESQKRAVDCRVVSAAQEEAIQCLDSGAFRRDLFQRLAGVVVELPQLADRPEDIVPLAAHFAELHGQRLEAKTAKVLEGYDWPGNVRELRLAIERAGCLVNNGTLPPSAVRDAIRLGAPVESGRRGDRRKAERRGRGTDRRQRFLLAAAGDIIAKCEACEWDIQRVMSQFHMGRSTVYDQLRAVGISMREVRKSGFPDSGRNPAGIPENDDPLET